MNSSSKWPNNRLKYRFQKSPGDNSSATEPMGSNLLTFMNLWICRKVEKKRGGEGLISLSLSTTMIYDIYHDIFPLSLSLSASLPSFHFIIFHSVGDYPFNDHIITSGRVFFPLLFINIFFFLPLLSLRWEERESGGEGGGQRRVWMEFEWTWRFHDAIINSSRVKQLIDVSIQSTHSASIYHSSIDWSEIQSFIR